MSTASEFYQKLSENESLGYGAPISQEVRFDSLLAHMQRTPESILDVGCGRGDLLYRLRSQFGSLPRRYCGVDITPGMILWARKTLPQEWLEDMVQLRVGSVQSFPMEEGPFDWVVGMCIFEIATTEAVLLDTVKSMYDRCRTATAFTAQWKDPSKIKPDQPETVFDPFDLVRKLRSLVTERITLDFSYAPHCYSVYLWKGESKWLRAWKHSGGW